MGQERFARVYAEEFDAVLGYALRRTDRPEDAADVVSEVFLTAWRRIGDVPSGRETRLWLYGVARRVLANHRRGGRRREALGERLRSELATAVPDHAPRVAAEQTLQSALATLAPGDREVLLLAAWEELEPREIATVLGISPVAARSRLSRARARLREVTGHDPSPPGHLLSNRPSLIPKEGR